MVCKEIVFPQQKQSVPMSINDIVEMTWSVNEILGLFDMFFHLYENLPAKNGSKKYP